MYRAYNRTPPPSPGASSIASGSSCRPRRLIDYTKQRHETTADGEGKNYSSLTRTTTTTRKTTTTTAATSASSPTSIRRSPSHQTSDDLPTPPARQPARLPQYYNGVVPNFRSVDENAVNEPNSEPIEFLFKIQSRRKNSTSYCSRVRSFAGNRWRPQQPNNVRPKRRSLADEINKQMNEDDKFLRLTVD